MTAILNKTAERRGDSSSTQADTDDRQGLWLATAYCLLTAVWPQYLFIPSIQAGLGYPPRVLAYAMLVSLTLGFFLPSRKPILTPALNPGTVILLYISIVVFLWGIGMSHFDGRTQEQGKVRYLLFQLAMTAVGLFMIIAANNIRHRTAILSALVIGTTYNAVVGLLQNGLGINLVETLQLPGFERVGKFDPAVLSERAGAVRALGTFGHPIEFAVATAASVFILLHLARYAPTRRVRQFAAAGVLIALLALPAAVSRSGLVALGVGTLFYIWTLKVRHIAIGIGVFSLMIPVFIAVFPKNADALWQTITGSDHDPSVLARVGRYDRVVASFHEHPIFGTGYGSEGVLDNQWLSTLVSGGIVGVIGLILLVIGGLFGFSSALRYAKDERERDQAYAIGAAFAAIAATMTTFDVMGFEQVTSFVFILFGLAWSSHPVTTTITAQLLPARNPAT